MIIKPDSSSHWYAVGQRVEDSYAGLPAYGSTLREARKENLLPSVTTVLKERANPALQAWKDTQLVMASLTLPELDGESPDDRAKRIVIDAREHGKKAAEKGDLIHSLIEQSIKGTDVCLTNYDPVVRDGCIKAMRMMHEEQYETQYCEDMFVNTIIGYGCRVDWAGVLGGEKTVVDFKTTQTKPGEKISGYLDWYVQLAANAKALPGIWDRHVNLVISTTEPGRVEWVTWSHDDIHRGWMIFCHLLRVFTLSRKMGEYDPDEGRYV